MPNLVTIDIDIIDDRDVARLKRSRSFKLLRTEDAGGQMLAIVRGERSSLRRWLKRNDYDLSAYPEVAQ